MLGRRGRSVSDEGLKERLAIVIFGWRVLAGGSLWQKGSKGNARRVCSGIAGWREAPS
jgi:hypothetical protein